MTLCSNSTNDFYDGELCDGKPHGKGTYTCFNGDKYEGEWKEGKRDGKGKLSFSDEKYYEGEWKEGKKHGKGNSLSVFGDIYNGEWKNNEKHGTGCVKYKNGDIYNGEWKNGLQNGNGTKVFKNGIEDGNVYVGKWKDGLMHGKGKMMFSNNSVYEGEWKNNYMEDGKMTYSSLSVIFVCYGNYEGKFIKKEIYRDTELLDDTTRKQYLINTHYGIRDGYGIMKFKFGNIYKGEWKNDLENGNGVITFEDGTKCEGNWIRKEVDTTVKGISKYVYKDGSIYEGGLVIIHYSLLGKSLHRYGKGKLTCINGDVFEGEWEYDRMCGEGTQTFAKNDILLQQGKFDRNELIHGIKQYSNNINRHYQNGKCVGYSKYNSKIYSFLWCLLIAEKINSKNKYIKIN